jgi:hypothetical protein
VAGRFADAGWNVYFPRRDRGFDFIVSKLSADGTQLIRPVQVKGKYPTRDKGAKAVYGYVGKLTELHPEMVLAIPFFHHGKKETPTCVAYLPFALIKKHSRGFRCQPARFHVDRIEPRRDFRRFFDEEGLRLVDRRDWSKMTNGDSRDMVANSASG